MLNMLDLNKHNRIITDIWHLKFSEESVKKEDNYFLDFITEAYTEPPPIWEQYISTIEKEEIFHTIYISNEENVITQHLRESDLMTPSDVFIGDYENKKFRKKIEEHIISKGFKNLKMEISDSFHVYLRYRHEIKSLNFYQHTPYLGVYYSREGLLRGVIHPDYFTSPLTLNYWGNKESFEQLNDYINRDFIENYYGAEALKRVLEHYQKNFIDNYEYGKSFLAIVGY